MLRLQELLLSRFTPRLQRAATLALTILIVLLIQGKTVFRKCDGHITGLFRIGDYFYNRSLATALAFPPYVHEDSVGFDGQFFYFLAHDPLLRGNVWSFLDDPRLRAQRIAYPALAYACVMGYKPLIPASLYTLNMVALAGCVILLGRRAAAAGGSFFYGLTFALCASTHVVVDVLTCEMVMLLFLFFAFRFLETKRNPALLLATLGAVLTKEICLIWVCALAVYALAGKRRRLILGVCAVFVVWLSWQAYLAVRIPSPYLPQSTLQNFDWPFKGAIEQVIFTWRNHNEPIKHHGFELGLMVTLLSMSVRALLGLRNQGWRDPIRLLFAGSGLCAIFLRRDCWEWSGNFARQLAILIAPALWIMPSGVMAKIDTRGHVAFSLWRLYAKVIRKIF